MSTFGNVPLEDVQIVGRAADMAALVVRALPDGAPAEWYPITYELVLEAVLHDWVTNGTDDLDSGDAEDVENIVRASADIALHQEPALQEISYRTVLKGWLADWVENWGSDE
ncbi:MAG: hypothetical protein HUU17_12180 [Chthonomonadales bacterium]|nr:hypothetical protein [Chthonomonadales bacterium]